MNHHNKRGRFWCFFFLFFFCLTTYRVSAKEPLLVLDVAGHAAETMSGRFFFYGGHLAAVHVQYYTTNCRDTQYYSARGEREAETATSATWLAVGATWLLSPSLSSLSLALSPPSISPLSFSLSPLSVSLPSSLSLH